MSDISKTFGGQYEIVSLLGAGGMAKVYRAHQLNIERDVALKIMSTALSDQKDFQVRFKREADVFARLEHPHILPIYDYGEHENYLYLVLRLMEGGTLEKLMRGKQLALVDLERLVTQVAAALDYAHENDIVHRDLKPNNVLLDNFGNAYLMDFGIAKIVSSAQQAADISTMLGTPAYMSPEQWRMDSIDHRIDIYSLGVIIYEMLTGEMPFRGHTPYHLMYAHLHDEPTVPSEIAPGLSAEIDAVALRALAKEPNARYQTAGELAYDLAEAIRKQTQDRRQNLTTLEGELQGTHSNESTRSDVVGSILLALDRPSGRVYAVPKVEDFQELVEQRNAPGAPRNFESWSIDEILQSLEEPARTSVDTDKLRTILRGGKTQQTNLGVHCHSVKLPETLQALTGQKSGLLVAEVEANTSAENAGLMLGDTLLAIDDVLLRNIDDLNNILKGKVAGETVPLRFLRAGQVQEIDIVLT